MIQNRWKRTRFFCLNGHVKPVPMLIQGEKPVFYACPRYALCDEKHPYGHAENERSCVNRISFSRAEAVIEHLKHIVDEDGKNGSAMDYTGMEFVCGTYLVRVLKYQDDEVHLGILNRRKGKL